MRDEAAYQRHYYGENKAHIALRRRLWKYKLTKEQFDTMFATQTGRCAICYGDLLSGTYGVAIDHDHATGKVRGLLCHPCNRGLGQFRDTAALLERATEYLKRHQ